MLESLTAEEIYPDSWHVATYSTSAKEKENGRLDFVTLELIEDKIKYNNMFDHGGYLVFETPEQRKVKVSLPAQYELGWHLIVKGIK